MRSYNHIIALFSFVFFSSSIFAQASTTESIQVSGNCGMCKKAIEGAAKGAGASTASWDEKTKMLAVSYEGSRTSNLLIQQAVAKAGYDTRDVKATTADYKALPSCCQYERKEASASGPSGKSMACCDKANCGKDDKACKDAGCCDGKTCKTTAKADCCDGKSCDKMKAGARTSASTQSGGMSCCSKS